mmetsp:Transcript_26107/g.98316  ORF Transcript_26107/g.98316 Transcript_26107/m.98316 type:complete len:332 (-) Transcript_26107:636-1631(-)
MRVVRRPSASAVTVAKRLAAASMARRSMIAAPAQAIARALAYAVTLGRSAPRMRFALTARGSTRCSFPPVARPSRSPRPARESEEWRATAAMSVFMTCASAAASSSSAARSSEPTAVASPAPMSPLDEPADRSSDRLSEASDWAPATEPARAARFAAVRSSSSEHSSTVATGAKRSSSGGLPAPSSWPPPSTRSLGAPVEPMPSLGAWHGPRRTSPSTCMGLATLAATASPAVSSPPTRRSSSPAAHPHPKKRWEHASWSAVGPCGRALQVIARGPESAASEPARTSSSAATAPASSSGPTARSSPEAPDEASSMSSVPARLPPEAALDSA